MNKMMEKVMNQMKWVAKNDRMDKERRADQCFGMLLGAEIALDIQDGEEWERLSEFWEDLRAEIFGYHR